MLAIECDAATKYFYEKTAYTGIKGKLGLQRKLKLTAVDQISLAVPKGEIFGIVGPNGSGKSTLIRMLSTLILPDAGYLKIFGYDVVRQSMQVRRRINRVSVEAAFFKRLSAWENLSYAARLYGLNAGTAKTKAVEILKTMGFKLARLYDPLEDLSRGTQQKVAIARAMFTSPVLLLLDEPTTGLDPISKRQVQEFILRMREIHDTTVLITSHDMSEMEHVCDRVAIIDRGRIIACDTPANLKHQLGNGKDTTLEDVFVALTGKNLVEDFD